VRSIASIRCFRILSAGPAARLTGVRVSSEIQLISAAFANMDTAATLQVIPVKRSVRGVYSVRMATALESPWGVSFCDHDHDYDHFCLVSDVRFLLGLFVRWERVEMGMSVSFFRISKKGIADLDEGEGL
jgi:hypothetical protein